MVDYLMAENTDAVYSMSADLELVIRQWKPRFGGNCDR